MTGLNKSSGNIKTYITLHVLCMVYSICSICAKFASQEVFLSLRFILFYGLDIMILGIYAIVWQMVLKNISLTVAFSTKAVSVIWGIVWGVLIFHETITLAHLAGAALIITGIIIMGSDKKNG